MASMTQSPVSFAGNFASKAPASDLLRSSINGVCGLPLKALGRAQLGAKRRDFSIAAKFRKVKKHEYPWPKDPDPNVKGGILSHLSHFKPLKEKLKPVISDFEKPLVDLQKKLVDVEKMANETGLDFSDQIMSLENKCQQALEYLYNHLAPIQRVNIARHPNRPTFLDHVFNITEKFVELHGDRAGYDDPAIFSGLGTINGRRYMLLGHQKGRNIKENIHRNFGMPTPHGYRKALRMMYYADHHRFPIITFIDTPGAYADIKSEQLGQGEAIAHNLRTMFGLKVPIISIVIGEGGSGGALAIGCANKLLMLENAVLYVASPEACAAILWKSAKAAPKAAKKLKITAAELTKLRISDGVIPESLGGAHADPYWTSQQIKATIVKSMDELEKMDTETLLEHRAQKFRKLGRCKERIPTDPKSKFNVKKKDKPIVPISKVNVKKKDKPIDPISKVNMKNKDKPLVPISKVYMKMKDKPVVPISKVNMKKKDKPVIPISKISESELRNEVGKLKVQILEASKSSAEFPEMALKEMIQKLKREIDHEYNEAAKALGMEDKILMVREEIAKAGNVNYQLARPFLREKIEQVKDEFGKSLPSASNYPRLKYKLDMLKDLSKALNLSKSTKKDDLKLEISKRFSEVMGRPDVKQRIEALKSEIANSGVSNIDSMPELKEKVSQLHGEIESEFKAFLRSVGFQVAPSDSEPLTKLKAFNEVTTVIHDSSDLKEKIELLKAEVGEAGNTPDEKSKNKIQALEAEIKQAIISSSELKEGHEWMAAGLLEATKSLVGSNGSFSDEYTEKSQVKVNLEASSSFV
ncbi:Acetyl-CoA carboxylase [Handroanthus impetiginosus]|uniref:acetyl-CoA carboxytransferase n=1 Tax=Handroanthus impetiginosus TaxID=429701 RepID=A0A2G9GB88_9LAMI|nr:Acetyl-CoA carboxylase [Handroanthus impetiginosus]